MLVRQSSDATEGSANFECSGSVHHHCAAEHFSHALICPLLPPSDERVFSWSSIFTCSSFFFCADFCSPIDSGFGGGVYGVNMARQVRFVLERRPFAITARHYIRPTASANAQFHFFFNDFSRKDTRDVSSTTSHEIRLVGPECSFNLEWTVIFRINLYGNKKCVRLLLTLF